MESIRHVTKRGGKLVEFDADKLNKWADWASQECGVYWSDIVLKALRGMYNGITTTEMQKQLIKTCVDYKDVPHSKMAARLLVGQIYKEAYGTHELPSLVHHYTSMVHRKLWDDMGYSVEELEKLNDVIDHSKDFTYSYATVKQFYDKYAVAVNDVCMESPQMALMALCMSNYRDDTTIMDIRVKNVSAMYNYLSDLCINLPTPTLNGERTNLLSSPSCCVISSKDTVDSIGAAVHVAYKMTAQRAGIGIELTTRAPKDPVKGGRVSHGGKFGYYKHVDSAVKANTQVTRGGSATVTFTCLDPEFDRLIRLKSPRTHDSQRLAFMDYSVAVNKSFLKRAATRDKWMMVSPYWAPKLYDLFYSGDIDGFEAEYERVLNDTTIERKTIVNAMDLLVDIVKYRVETGRIYLTFIDNLNSHTPFKEPIRLSNLCVAPESKIQVLVGDQEMEIEIQQLTELMGSTNNILVKSRNILKGIDEWKPITAFAMTGKNRKVLKITDSESGKSLVCTPEHKVFTINRGYVEAAKLKEDDQLQIL